MKKNDFGLEPNLIARFLGKPPADFTKRDLIRFIEKNRIEMVNFRYVGGDGKLKMLNFYLTGRAHLDRLLSAGERVDGSNLFSHIDARSSDLYVVPRYRTAYVNPFSEIPAVDILCSYFNKDGEPLPSAPGEILRKAAARLKEATGFSLEAMGELEYYVLFERDPLFAAAVQKGYHEAAPFSKWEGMRIEAMQAIARAGGKLKYAHSEVGSNAETTIGMEQDEIEFQPVCLEDAADQIVVAKWILRMLGHRHRATVTFAPKVLVGLAGSGLHVHTRLVKDGRNMMTAEGVLSDVARKVIAGFLRLAPSLTAFGNTVPVSYLRLVPHQEAPTNICWGDRNRSVLVRVPLGWLKAGNMIRQANPREAGGEVDFSANQTVEFRCPDGSANIHLLLAGLAVAARHGLVEMQNALAEAQRLYVDVNIFDDAHKDVRERLPQLPASCVESAERLLADRAVYEKDGVFTPATIDGVAAVLRAHDDKHLSERLRGKSEEIEALVRKFLHCA